MKNLAVRSLEIFSVITDTPKHRNTEMLPVALSCCAVTLHLKGNNTSSAVVLSGSKTASAVVQSVKK